MDEKNGKEGMSSGRRWLIFIIVNVFILGAGYTAYRLYLNHLINEALDGIRAQGYPATPEELDEWYEYPPEGENAADIYLQAFTAYKKPSKEDLALLPVEGEGKFPPPGEPLPEEMERAITDFLASNEECLRLLREGATYTACRYPIDLTQGYEAELPHLALLRTCTRLLAVRAAMDARQGDMASAVQSVLTSLRLAQSLANEPNMISQVLRTALCRISLDSLARVLSSAALDDGQLVTLAVALRQAESPDSLHRSHVGERACAASLRGKSSDFEFFFGGTVWYAITDRLRARLSFFIYKTAGYRELDFLAMLHVFGEMVAASRAPYEERLARFEAISREEEHLREKYWRYRLALSIMPAYGTAVESDVSGEAHRRTAYVALALERYRLAEGELPGTLRHLVPTYLDEVPLDPFDGTPLRYRKLEKGYVVYSIGEDERDDGGVQEDRAKKWDIVFRVTR